MGVRTSINQHTMIPLKLETLALRVVITNKGVCSDYTGLMAPKMRQELEQLSRLPGDYEIVAEEITVTRRDDGREVINDNWRRRTKNGERISVACEDCGLRWKVVICKAWRSMKTYSWKARLGKVFKRSFILTMAL